VSLRSLNNEFPVLRCTPLLAISLFRRIFGIITLLLPEVAYRRHTPPDEFIETARSRSIRMF
jgi:hypothetical protein